MQLGLNCGLSFIFPVTSSKVLIVLIFRVELITIFALNGDSMIYHIFELLQGCYSLLKIHLFILHLYNLHRKILIGSRQLLVLFLDLLICLLIRRLSSLIVVIQCLKQGLLELFLILHLIHEYLHLCLHRLSFHVPFLFLVIADLWIATGA